MMGATFLDSSPRRGEVARAKRRAGEGERALRNGRIPLTPALFPAGRGSALAPFLAGRV
jgi:hypothetical protein